MNSSMKWLPRVALPVLCSAAVVPLALGIDQSTPQGRQTDPQTIGVIDSYQPVWSDGGTLWYRVRFFTQTDFDAGTTSGTTHQVTYTENVTSLTQSWPLQVTTNNTSTFIGNKQNLTALICVPTKPPKTKGAKRLDSGPGTTGTGKVFVTGTGYPSPQTKTAPMTYSIDGSMVLYQLK